MTRAEFDEQITTIDDLIDFDYDHGPFGSIFEGLISEDDLNSSIEDDIRDFLNYDAWYNLPDLSDIDRYGSFYLREGLLEYRCIDDCFAEFYESMVEYLDAIEWWEDEEEDRDDHDAEDEDDTQTDGEASVEDNTPVEDEAIPIGDLFSGSSRRYHDIMSEIATQEELARQFAELPDCDELLVETHEDGGTPSDDTDGDEPEGAELFEGWADELFTVSF